MLKERKVPLDLISRASGIGMDINHEGRLLPVHLLIVDPDLVPLLALKALHGDLRAALSQHDGIAITPGLMRKLWGELPPEQALGRRFESRGIFFTVKAIIPDFDPRAPIGEASPMVGDAKAMVGFESQGNFMSQEARDMIYASSGRVFARLPSGVSVDQIGGWMREAFEANPLYAQLPAEWKANGRQAAFFRGITLTQLPFEGAENEQRWRLLAAVAAASALLLMLAAFNCMNLQTANLLMRQRETALRRSVGADSVQLLSLWGAEVLLSLLVAAAGAVLLAWLLAPVLANWIGMSPGYSIADPFPPQALLGLGVTVLVLLVLVLAPPAWRALRRIPAPALQGRTMSEGPWGRRTRQGLLTLQLAGALLLLLLAGVLTSQQHYLLNADRGFDTRNRLWFGFMVNSGELPNLDAFTAALGPTSRRPALVLRWRARHDLQRRDRYVREPVAPQAGAAHVHRFAELLRDLWHDAAGWSAVTGLGEQHLVLDAKAARLLGFASPQDAVGAIVLGGSGYLQEGNNPRRVVAVVKDVKLESARDPAMPQGFLLSDEPQWDLSLYGPDMAALRQTADELWKAYGPQLPYMIESADELRAEVYEQEQQMTTMVSAVALLAAGVAMLGAYALVSDTLRRRRTELVLHRLHGAGPTAIVRVVTSEFVVPLMIAVTVGLPMGAWLGRRYLAGFVDRVDAGSGIVIPMLAAFAAILLVTAIAALRHVRQALTLQPVEALG